MYNIIRIFGTANVSGQKKARPQTIKYIIRREL